MNDVYRPDPSKPMPHQHKWFLAQRGSEFRQVNPGNTKLHEKVEWAYLVCSCASVIKTEIEELDKGTIK